MHQSACKTTRESYFSKRPELVLSLQRPCTEAFGSELLEFDLTEAKAASFSEKTLLAHAQLVRSELSGPDVQCVDLGGGCVNPRLCDRGTSPWGGRYS